MNITKDEARILSYIIDWGKSDFCRKFSYEGLFYQLSELQDKLELSEKDNRRNGRTSQDGFRDCIERFIK